MVNWAKSHGYNNVGILTDGSSFGNELTADTLAQMKTDGLHLVKIVTYSPTSVVLTTPVEQLRQAGAQTVFPTGSRRAGPRDRDGRLAERASPRPRRCTTGYPLS